MLHYLRRYRARVTLLAACVCGAAISAVVVQYNMKLLVDAISIGPQTGNHAWMALAYFLLFVATESVLWRMTGWAGCEVSVRMGAAARLDLFEHVTQQPMTYFNEQRSGSLGLRIAAISASLSHLLHTTVWRILPPCVDFCGAIVIFAAIHVPMAVVLTAFVMVTLLAFYRFGSRGRPLHERHAFERGLVTGELVDVISNIWCVKAFSARRRETERLGLLLQQEVNAERHSWLYTERARLIYDVVLWGSAAAMLVWALYLWQVSQATVGDVVIISAMTFRMLHGARDLVIATVDANRESGSISEALRTIRGASPIANISHPRELPPTAGTIRFVCVSFDYGTGRNALNNLSVEIPLGQKVGIVGPSGAGKSTVLVLLQRLYDPDVGIIEIAERPLKEVAPDKLRASLAVVPQETNLLHRSILENILIAKPNASRSDVEAAAEAAGCSEFIKRLPDGYDTLVGERGGRLSGGQRQRIGIARAFLKKTPILLLDEATSALDSETELAIQHSLLERTSGQTVISVAHRLSTVAGFDRLLVMQDGRIVEDGTPYDLRRSGATAFNKLWALQARGLAPT